MLALQGANLTSQRCLEALQVLSQLKESDKQLTELGTELLLWLGVWLDIQREPVPVVQPDALFVQDKVGCSHPTYPVSVCRYQYFQGWWKNAIRHLQQATAPFYCCSELRSVEVHRNETPTRAELKQTLEHFLSCHTFYQEKLQSRWTDRLKQWQLFTDDLHAERLCNEKELVDWRAKMGHRLEGTILDADAMLATHLLALCGVAHGFMTREPALYMTRLLEIRYWFKRVADVYDSYHVYKPRGLPALMKQIEFFFFFGLSAVFETSGDEVYTSWAARKALQLLETENKILSTRAAVECHLPLTSVPASLALMEKKWFVPPMQPSMSPDYWSVFVKPPLLTTADIPTIRLHRQLASPPVVEQPAPEPIAVSEPPSLPLEDSENSEDSLEESLAESLAAKLAVKKKHKKHKLKNTKHHASEFSDPRKKFLTN